MYNCINGILLSTFSDYFVRNRDVHQCNTRQADDLRLPFGRLDVRKFTIKIHGAQVWNSLPQYIRSATAINVFKMEVKIFPNRQEYSYCGDSILMLTYVSNAFQITCFVSLLNDWHDNLLSHVTEIICTWLCVLYFVEIWMASLSSCAIDCSHWVSNSAITANLYYKTHQIPQT